jgi:hypothetical protein
MTQGNAVNQTITSRRRQLPRWLVLTPIVATPLVIVAVVYVIGCWRADANLRREIEFIRERGEPLRFAELAHHRDDVEALSHGKKVAALVDRLQGAPGDFLDEVGTKGISPGGAKQIEETVAPYLADVQAIVDELRGGKCLFEYDYQTREPYSIPLNHVTYLRNAARVLSADAHVALAGRDKQRACQRVRDMFELDEALRHDPFILSQLTRQAIGNRAVELLQFVLGHEAATEAELGLFGEGLGELEANFRLAACMQAERAMLLAVMENLGSPGTEQIFTSGAMPPAEASSSNRWWGSWPYRPRRVYQEALMLRTLTRWVDLVDRPGPAAASQFAAVNEQVLSEDFPILHALLKRGFDESTVRDTGLHYRQRLISARLALAVVRHRTVHAALPASLDELDVPSTDRLGLISGKPLVYQPTTAGPTSGQAEGFAIYDESPDKWRFEVRYADAGETPDP